MPASSLETAGELLFHWSRGPAYWGTRERIAAALELTRGERVLDVGCGTGFFADLVPGLYVGLDNGLTRLALARRHAASSSHSFVVMSADDLGFADHSFDKALVINMVHHIDATAVQRLLAELRRVVRKRVLLVDAAPDIANRLESFFLRHDRGDYFRDRAELRAMIERHWAIEDEQVFHNTLHTVPQVLFVMRPRDAAAGTAALDR